MVEYQRLSFAEYVDGKSINTIHLDKISEELTKLTAEGWQLRAINVKDFFFILRRELPCSEEV